MYPSDYSPTPPQKKTLLVSLEFPSCHFGWHHWLRYYQLNVSYLQFFASDWSQPSGSHTDGWLKKLNPPKAPFGLRFTGSTMHVKYPTQEYQSLMSAGIFVWKGPALFEPPSIPPPGPASTGVPECPSLLRPTSGWALALA